MSAVVFICGISGVGKTHLLKALTSQIRSISRVSAGELVGEVAHIGDEKLRQIELGKRLVPRKISGQTIAIDGHLVFPREAAFFDVPFEALCALRPDGMIAVKDAATTIFDRRKNDLSREREELPVDLLEEWQKREVAQARRYSKRLGIACREVSATDTPRFIAAFKDLACLA